MANPDRLSGLDASFLALEEGGAHMHVGSVMLFEGDAPDYEDFVAQVERRLALVPRYRQKLAFPPLVEARPVWVDDPHFNARYHLRHTALPAPAGEAELQALAGRVFAQRLDRSKPLWEIWLVDRVEEGRFALIAKTHHCLVDGVSGVDIATVLFDLDADPEPPAEIPPPWAPRPEPSAATLLADVIAERATAPLDVVRAVGGVVGGAPDAAARIGGVLGAVGSVLRAGLGAPASPFNVPIGPHRRFCWVEADLGRFKGIKNGLGGTVNDVVLAAVTGALRAYLLAHDEPVDGLELKAMVPVSVRAEAERGALGNRVSTMYAPLPVGLDDPLERYEHVRDAMAGLKESGQAVGADVLTRLTGFAPPTIVAQAARLQTRQRFFNLTVTNVPGPQFPLYLMGRELLALHPQVPLARNTAIGVAIMSYHGGLNFGLISDLDTVPDLHVVAAALEATIDELADLAGLPVTAGRT